MKQDKPIFNNLEYFCMIVGYRQVGKTTKLKSLIEDTLEEFGEEDSILVISTDFRMNEIDAMAVRLGVKNPTIMMFNPVYKNGAKLESGRVTKLNADNYENLYSKMKRVHLFVETPTLPKSREVLKVFREYGEVKSITFTSLPSLVFQSQSAITDNNKRTREFEMRIYEMRYDGRAGEFLEQKKVFRLNS